MPSSEVLVWFLSASVGLMLGAIFFGGLWWTVRNGINAKQPGLWFLGSMIVRMTIVVAGFHFVGGGQSGRLLSSLIGFIAARSIVVWLTRLPQSKTLIRNTEVVPCSEPAACFPGDSQHAT